MKVALFNLPAISFRTGTLATLFYALRQYSLIYFIIWLLAVLICSITVKDFWGGEGILLVYPMCLNIFTTALPGRSFLKAFGKPETVFRLATWSTFIINSLALCLCYILPKKTITTFHIDTRLYFHSTFTTFFKNFTFLAFTGFTWRRKTATRVEALTVSDGYIVSGEVLGSVQCGNCPSRACPRCVGSGGPVGSQNKTN